MIDAARFRRPGYGEANEALAAATGSDRKQRLRGVRQAKRDLDGQAPAARGAGIVLR